MGIKSEDVRIVQEAIELMKENDRFVDERIAQDISEDLRTIDKDNIKSGNFLGRIWVAITGVGFAAYGILKIAPNIERGGQSLASLWEKLFPIISSILKRLG